MPISVTALPLELRHPFRIAHGTSTVRNNALVRIAGGVGEAALPPYYPTTHEEVAAWVDSVREPLEAALKSDQLNLVATLESLPDGPTPAMAAVDMALHDIWGRQLGHPLFRLFGLGRKHLPLSSYALPIPLSMEDLDRQLAPVIHFPFLKLKIGSGDVAFDEAVVRKTREQYGGQLCVDVNGGWSMDAAIRLIPKLQDLDLAFVEQPIAARDIDDWHLLKRMLRGSTIPLVADESVQGPEDIIALAGAAEGVNIKLAKCGGILNARKMIHLARSLDLKVMLGCMIESSIALTAAAHLGAMADWLDLDGQLHLAQDPFSGLTFEAGTIGLPDAPGLGVVPAK